MALRSILKTLTIIKKSQTFCALIRIEYSYFTYDLKPIDEMTFLHFAKLTNNKIFLKDIFIKASYNYANIIPSEAVFFLFCKYNVFQLQACRVN